MWNVTAEFPEELLVNWNSEHLKDVVFILIFYSWMYLRTILEKNKTKTPTILNICE